MGADTKEVARHKSVTLLRSPGVQHPLILTHWCAVLKLRNYLFWKLACWSPPKTIFCLISIENWQTIGKSRFLLSRICINFSSSSNFFQYWHIFGQASKENVGSTYISLLNPNYWGLLDGLASSFWSSNISENFGIWRRKSVTPCWSKKNYFSGKIDGKP